MVRCLCALGHQLSSHLSSFLLLLKNAQAPPFPGFLTSTSTWPGWTKCPFFHHTAPCPYTLPSCSLSRGSELTSCLPPLLYYEFSEGRNDALLILASTVSQRAHKRHSYIIVSQTDLSTTFHTVRNRLGNAILKATTKIGIHLRCLKPSPHK